MCPRRIFTAGQITGLIFFSLVLYSLSGESVSPFEVVPAKWARPKPRVASRPLREQACRAGGQAGRQPAGRHQAATAPCRTGGKSSCNKPPPLRRSAARPRSESGRRGSGSRGGCAGLRGGSGSKTARGPAGAAGVLLAALWPPRSGRAGPGRA